MNYYSESDLSTERKSVWVDKLEVDLYTFLFIVRLSVSNLKLEGSASLHSGQPEFHTYCLGKPPLLSNQQ